MAAKRFLDEDDDEIFSKQKRTKTRPTLASVIREVLALNFLENMRSALEPVLRQVVHEEIQSGIQRCMQSIKQQIPPQISQSSDNHDNQNPTLKLIFKQTLSLPIFTNIKISDSQNNPLQILLVNTKVPEMPPSVLPFPTKIEIVVLDGDFPDNRAHRGTVMWSEEEFTKSIVKERSGKRPLLAGEVIVTMRGGVALVGDLEFTDNSSWIRGRKFRLGARVVHGGGSGGIRVQEAMTEAFVVKDHRGELYKKHHPPALEDEVWRLEKIGKDGAFHRKLASAGINTVQDFLKLSVVDPNKLRKILGIGMSDKMWDVTLRHAKTCVLGTKQFMVRENNCVLYLNPICEIVKAEIHGQFYFTSQLSSVQRAYIDNLVSEAYANWDSLEQVDVIVNEASALLTHQGEIVDQYPNQNQTMVRSYQGQTLGTEESFEVASFPNDIHGEYPSNWVINSFHNYHTENNTPAENRSCLFSESSTEGDLHSSTNLNGKTFM